MDTTRFFTTLLILACTLVSKPAAWAANAKTIHLPTVYLSGSPTPDPQGTISSFGQSQAVDQIASPLGFKPAFTGPTPEPVATPFVQTTVTTLYPEANPQNSAQPTPETSTPPAIKANGFDVRIAYNHTLGNPNYHGDPGNGLGFEPSSASSFELDIGNHSKNPIYIGIGYQWLGDLYQYGDKIDQSANRVFFQIGFERTLVTVSDIDWRLGASFQYYPRLDNSNAEADSDDETTTDSGPVDLFTFEYGVGYKLYTSLHFLNNYFVNVGYESLLYAYKNTPDTDDTSNFYLSHYAFFLSVGVGF